MAAFDVSAGSPPRVVESIGELRAHLGAARWQSERVGFVPTMGGLHEGHRSLIEAARAECGVVVVSIFVNPIQFGPDEDFDRYPRTWESDRALCRDAGVDLIFMPSPETMYPPGFSTFVEVGGLSDRLEGAARPGHFRGVATVVLKLFATVRPDFAYFGDKDFQQLLLLRKMVDDFALPVKIRACPTIREPDGLAASSRNRYLNEQERAQASAIPQALFVAAEALRAGEMDLAGVCQPMRAAIEENGLTVDYATICDPESLKELTEVQPEMVLLVAARIGSVRLIDHAEVTRDGAAARKEPRR